jgi:hypothetical protein
MVEAVEFPGEVDAGVMIARGLLVLNVWWFYFKIEEAMALIGRPDYWCEATLTHTMADSRRADWERVLAPYRGKVRSVLEVGCYEGQSALFWLNFFDCEQIVCIDNWANFAHGTACPYEVENHFDANLRPWRNRLNKIKSDSTVALHSLREFEFDFIYIDGDHSEDQVMVDSCLAWPLLRPGGVMVWDDFIDQGGGLSVEWAVRKFLELHPHRVLHEGGQQMMVEKVTSPSRQRRLTMLLKLLHNVFRQSRCSQAGPHRGVPAGPATIGLD